MTYKRNRAVAIECGIWYAEKLIGSADPGTECDEVPFLAFTEGGDVLVESNDLSSLSYVRLGKMHTAYISLGEYEELLSGLTLRKGYGAEYFHGNVKKVWRIIPSVSSGIEHDEIYLFRTERDLYF